MTASPHAVNQGAWATQVLPAGHDEAWRQLLLTHPMARCVVPMWEEVAGWTSHRIGLYSAGRLVGGLIVALRRIPRLPWRLARCTCVMVGPARHAEMLETLLGAADRFARERSVVEIDLRLRIPAGDVLPGFEYHAEVDRLLREAGYRALGKVESSYLLRIDREDDAILSTFASDCRSHVRKALKEGAVVEAATDAKAFDDFWEATQAMVERKQAPTTPRAGLVDGMKPLFAAGFVQLFTSSFQGRAANLAITDILGIPTDMAAARTPASVRGEIPGGGQVLQFGIMKRMRDQGRIWYDLGGCEGPEPIEGHPNYGVWKYKSRYKGTFVNFLPFYRKARGPISRKLLEIVHRRRGDYM